MTKVAIVTGASRGIGKGVTLYLASEGYALALIATTAESLYTVAREVEGVYEERRKFYNELKQSDKSLAYSSIPKPKIYAIDVSNKSKVDEAISQTIAEYKQIDLLFSSAGIYSLGTTNIDSEGARKMFDVNYWGAMHCIDAVVPTMCENHSGRIIVVGSRAAETARPAAGLYAGSKAALAKYCEALSKKLMEYGVGVTVLNPGIVDTDMVAKSNIPVEQRIPVKDIVAAVRYILSLAPHTHVSTMRIDSSVDINAQAKAETHPLAVLQATAPSLTQQLPRSRL